MKLALIPILIALCLPSCASKSDPTFMNNASASINGGFITTANGPMMAPGIETPAVHPFFGTPIATRP